MKNKSRQILKVIHVELKEPYNGEHHYYFGGKSAIYSFLPEETIGIKKESLWNVDLKKGEYQNRLCKIRMGTLIRKNISMTINEKIHIDENRIRITE